MTKHRICVPLGNLSSGTSDEEAAARKRREMRERLLRGQSVEISQAGRPEDDNKDPNQPTIRVPEGKLAAGFYWYERDPELYREEVTAMNRFFPQFKLDKLSDGRLSWHGLIRPDNLRPGARWYLQLVYDNNHPHNSSWGGSVKVYSVEPQLDQFLAELGGIPHLLRDQAGQLYLCTARPEDFRASSSHSTSAASALAWAVKWITAFELWMAGDITTAQFAGHSI